MSVVPHVAKERPPFVRFEDREVGIDPDASKEAGRQIPIMKALALVTPHGSKDVVEKYAEQWLDEIAAKALRGDYPLEWSNLFRAQYDAWRKGNELPRTGTPILTWQMIAIKEQRTRLIALGITTVEDLAAVPDGGLGTVGLDGRYLRDLARGWLAEAKELGASAKEVADLKAENLRLSEKAELQQGTINSLRDRLDALERRNADQDAQVEADPAPRRRGRQTQEA
jgi:hypothetical protein